MTSQADVALSKLIFAALWDLTRGAQMLLGVISAKAIYLGMGTAYFSENLYSAIGELYNDLPRPRKRSHRTGG